MFATSLTKTKNSFLLSFIYSINKKTLLIDFRCAIQLHTILKLFVSLSTQHYLGKKLYINLDEEHNLIKLKNL